MTQTRHDLARLDTVAERAGFLADHGGLDAAIDAGLVSDPVTVSAAEGLVLGLLRQGVRKYLVILGHGSTVIADILRVYEEAGLIRCWQFRNEVEMAHAATALSWIHDEVPAVLTSIGPGALQAMAGSLAAASNGVGVYHIYGDETTHGEGYNMQQVPKPEQGLFGRITALMSASYTLHTPAALRDGLRKGATCVFHPWKAAPFYWNMPINTQPASLTLRLDALPARPIWPALAPVDDAVLDEAARAIAASPRVVMKLGGGSRRAAHAVEKLAAAAGAAVVLSPGTLGVLPDGHPQNMHVGGSKGSISGNWAMEEADLLITIGSRAVCQSDCSGIGWPKVTRVVNLNADPHDLNHYNATIALPGEAGTVAGLLADRLEAMAKNPEKEKWLGTARERKVEWQAFRKSRGGGEPRLDPVWQRPVLTQPQVIATADRFCREIDALKFFDAGDVQANGFQIVEDERPFSTFTESGSSYMGFAVSALLAQALADKGRYGVAFTGDGSFMMNPQILIDGVEHGVHGTILLLDNRRMAAIATLQQGQHGAAWRTGDSVAVDYVNMARSFFGVAAFHGGHSIASLEEALRNAQAHPGLSLIHVPVYHGTDEEGGMGAYGQWNVGSWCEDVQEQYARTAI